MLLAAVIPRAATTLSMLLAIRAAALDNSTESEDAAITRDSVKESILGLCSRVFIGNINTLYSELLEDCINGCARDRFHSGTVLMPGFKIKDDIDSKKMFVTLYLLSCEDPDGAVDRLILANPTHKRYEVLLDLVNGVDLDAMYLKELSGKFSFNFTLVGLKRGVRDWREFKPRMLELLRGKITEAVSVRTGEYLKSLYTANKRFNANARVDAYLHLLRRYDLHSEYFYDDFSDLMADALSSRNLEETIDQFIKPLTYPSRGPDRTNPLVNDLLSCPVLPLSWALSLLIILVVLSSTIFIV
ncbi:hypothetical protein PAPHI01_0970 [Pancytospora philotis]|nr:hypothetical protein PAPHI01_0970 [Pancytospora philotis]